LRCTWRGTCPRPPSDHRNEDPSFAVSCTKRWWLCFLPSVKLSSDYRHCVRGANSAVNLLSECLIYILLCLFNIGSVPFRTLYPWRWHLMF
jgi:hypothetical protein